MNRDFKGVWIPKDIWLDSNLTWMEKLFLVEIDSLDNEEGCFASNSYFADFFQLTSGRASQIIKSLIDKKYISANYERKDKQIIKRVLKILKGGSKYIKGGYLENAEDNNTLINNTCSTPHEEKLKVIVNPIYIELSRTMYLEHKKHDFGYLHGKNLEATFERWAKDIRLLCEKDGRSVKDIERVIRWCQSDGNFWIPNILSGKKLREKFPTLYAQMNKNESSKKLQTELKRELCPVCGSDSPGGICMNDNCGWTA